MKHTVFIVAVLGVLLGTTLTVAATRPQLKTVTGITVSQVISTQKMKVTWQTTKHAKKYVVKVLQGKTLVSTKTTRTTRVTFAEKLFREHSTYKVKVRAKGTSQYRASTWNKKVFEFIDLDHDNDEVADETDSDDDNDGIADDDDALPFDHDNDGSNDDEDDDDDNDLFTDVEDEFPLDHDNDGIPDAEDDDDDNDGILDVDEAPGQQFDEDNDGIEDYVDEDYIAEHTPTETFTIEIENNTFVAGDITIGVNDSVQWSNNDTFGHSVVSDGVFESPPLESGESYTYQFTAAGVYDYYDPVFADTMTGTITVEE